MHFNYLASALLFFSTLSYSSGAILTTIDGEKIGFDSLKGKWVLINYWASWCEPCLTEISELNRFYRIKTKQIALFAVNYEGLSLRQQLYLIKKYDIRYPSLKKDPGRELKLDLPQGVPVTYVFNPKGKLIKTLFGPQTQTSLSKLVD